MVRCRRILCRETLPAVARIRDSTGWPSGPSEQNRMLAIDIEDE